MMSELCGDEAPFMAESQTAMDRMMSDMNIAPSGDVDRDFSAMMIPHHRAAIAMAQAELRYGRNESLRRIAQEIIVDQQQEIAVMRLALDQRRCRQRPRRPGSQITGEIIMKRILALTTSLCLSGFSAMPAWSGQAPGLGRTGHSGQPSRPGLCRRAVLQHGLGHRSRGQQAARRHQARRARARQFSPLYRGQLLVHGMGFSPDHRTLAVVSIGSNSVTFIDTATNMVKHTTYVGRSPHEAFFTPDGKEVWVTVRGENYVAVLDPVSYEEKTRIEVPNGPGMQIFSPDGKYGYVCSSFNPEIVVISVADHEIVGKVRRQARSVPNIAATPDGAQVWFTLKDIGKAQVFDARPPFTLLKTLDTGPITNHVNIVRNAQRTVRLHHRRRPERDPGLPHRRLHQGRDHPGRQAAARHLAIGRRFAGLCRAGERRPTHRDRHAHQQRDREHPDRPGASGRRLCARCSAGRARVRQRCHERHGRYGQSQSHEFGAARYCRPGRAFRHGPGRSSLRNPKALTSVSLFDQGLSQVLQAAATGLEPKHAYVLALATHADGSGKLEPLASFMTNPAGSAIVNALGPIRQIVQSDTEDSRRYLVSRLAP